MSHRGKEESMSCRPGFMRYRRSTRWISSQYLHRGRAGMGPRPSEGVRIYVSSARDAAPRAVPILNAQSDERLVGRRDPIRGAIVEPRHGEYLFSIRDEHEAGAYDRTDLRGFRELLFEREVRDGQSHLHAATHRLQEIGLQLSEEPLVG